MIAALWALLSAPFVLFLLGVCIAGVIVLWYHEK